MKSAILALAVFSMASAAQAGPAVDAFGKCLVQSSTGKDRIAFIRWMYAAMSAHPDVRSTSAISPELRNEISAQAGAVMDRLVLNDCHAQAVAAVREGGATAVASSFEVFGRVAMTELMADPSVGKELNALSSHIDEARWNQLAAEAKQK